MEKIKVYEKLLHHMDNFWPKNSKEQLIWQLGPVKKVLPNFSVIRVAPKAFDEPWVYLTHGAWEVDFKKNYRLEFFLICPFEETLHVETLTMLANFHADPRYHLDLGKSVEIGRGWRKGSHYNHLLISLPYPYGPDLEICKVDRKNFIIRYLWLLPIDADENNYLKQQGLEALEQKFDEVGIDFLAR